MRIADKKAEKYEDVKEEICDLLDRMKHTAERKSDVARLSDGSHCVRIQKFFANEQLAISKQIKIDFKVNGIEYEGAVKSAGEFPEEVVIIISDVKVKKEG